MQKNSLCGNDEIGLRTLTLGPLATNCYILYKNNAAVVIDPGSEPEKILSALNKLQIKPAYIIYTHAHWDHTGAGYELKKQSGAEVLMGKNEVVVFNNKLNLNQQLDIGGEAAQADRLLVDGEHISLDGIKLKVLLTPGHTPGGISLYMNPAPVYSGDSGGANGWLFSGDTVFLNSIGRTDLPGGNYEEIEKSIIHKIYMLDDNTKIFPGHGPETTVGWEKKNNPYFRI